jgi:hypothetical protein
VIGKEGALRGTNFDFLILNYEFLSKENGEFLRSCLAAFTNKNAGTLNAEPSSPGKTENR